MSRPNLCIVSLTVKDGTTRYGGLTGLVAERAKASRVTMEHGLYDDPDNNALMILPMTGLTNRVLIDNIETITFEHA